MSSSFARFALVSLLAVPVGGCFGLFEPDPQPDGESCDVAEDCESGVCVGGMCVGSSCNDRRRCEPGFACSEPGTLEEVLSLGLASGSCVPTCEVCPVDEPRWSCSGNACGWDASPHVDAGGPYSAVAGEPLRVSGSAELAPDREIERAHWSSWQEGELAEGLEADVIFMIPGTHEITLTVTDDGHGRGDGSAQVSVCSPEGGACRYDQDCCEGRGLVCDVHDVDGLPTCEPAPT